MLLSHIPNIPLRILKFEIRAEITEYDANNRAGLVENDVFANSLILLGDPYKCLNIKYSRATVTKLKKKKIQLKFYLWLSCFLF